MKRKKIMLCGIAMINILLFSILSTSASSWTDSGKVSHLPTWGNVKDLNRYNKKTTTQQTASFNTSQVSAALPCFGRLRNSNGALRSEWIYLISAGIPYYGKEYDAEKGYNYYASVKTSDFEFGSGNSVTFKFSADKLN